MGFHDETFEKDTYTARSMEDIRRFLCRVVVEGEDSMKPQRLANMHRHIIPLEPGGLSAGAQLADIMYQKLHKEAYGQL